MADLDDARLAIECPLCGVIATFTARQLRASLAIQCQKCKRDLRDAGAAVLAEYDRARTVNTSHRLASHRARIYLHSTGDERDYEYLGELDVDRQPGAGEELLVMFRDGVRTCRVEIVSPLDWKKRGLIPVLYVTSGAGRHRR